MTSPWPTSHLPNLLVPDQALSVAGLTDYIRSRLEQDPQLQQIWVTGEVSSATQYRSGVFFTLQDPDAKAAISCVVWSHQLSKLAVVPVPGETLILLGRIHVQPHRGTYQLVTWQTLPGGEGLRALRYRQLRDRLAAEGLFDRERKRPLPVHPQTVAVVTSPQAAAWGDIQRTLKRRYPGLRVLFSPTLVQGEQAPASIVAAIGRVERDNRADVLILSRGGGAIEDMACFNDEQVVRAIANCRIPIISGIGHQRDESLADLAADVYVHTPTAAAEQAIPCFADLLAEHQSRSQLLNLAISQSLGRAEDHLQTLRDRMSRLRLDQQLSQEAQQIAWLRQRLWQSTQQQLQTATQHCQFLQEKLVSLDPKAVLQRGYAIVRQSASDKSASDKSSPDRRLFDPAVGELGEIVRSAADLIPGQALTIQLGQGSIRVQVTDIL